MVRRSYPAAESPIVAVIASEQELARAIRLRHSPDYFELRLDILLDALAKVDAALPKLRSPIILTARHPAEGGNNQLDAAERTNLLRRFLDRAAFVDLELRSLGEIRLPRREGLRLILSRHELADTPPIGRLEEMLQEAIRHQANIFKIATRTDDREQLERLVSFSRENAARFPIAAMGMGTLGAESRKKLARLGTALRYASLGQPNIEGQPHLHNLRRTRRTNLK